jgi:hypothetical protein
LTILSIQHNRNTTAVLIEIFDTAGNRVEGHRVRVVDANNVEVEFAVAQSGRWVVNSSGGAASGSSGDWVEEVVPAGVVDGVNRAFTLPSPPVTPYSLRLFRNGILLRRNVDFSLDGTDILFCVTCAPTEGDALLAYYRISP